MGFGGWGVLGWGNGGIFCQIGSWVGVGLSDVQDSFGKACRGIIGKLFFLNGLRLFLWIGTAVALCLVLALALAVLMHRELG